MIIRESEMNFGPFDENDVFYIEQSTLYKKLGENVKIAEFILKKDTELICIEAKSSSPQMLKKKDGSPSDYILEISDKLTNTLDLFISSNLNIIKDTENEAKSLIDFKNVQSYKINLYLVINGHEKEWLPNIQQALEAKLLAKMKIWNIDVKVINHEIAKQYKLIS